MLRPAKRLITGLMDKAGIELGRDMTVHDESFYRDVLLRGSLGLGESYVKGKWDAEKLDDLITRMLRAELEDRFWLGTVVGLNSLFSSLLTNRQQESRNEEVADKHYNMGNFLFHSFLDKNRQYSCAYFKKADTLDEAQVDKMKLIAGKLDLKEGEHLLDIGCGWGGLANFLAEQYGVRVKGISNSQEQVLFAKTHAHEGTTFEKKDYRSLEGSYDKILSVGMFEHVGPKNHRTFMRKVDDLLKEGGIFLLHTIGGHRSVNHTDPWFDREIFPNGVIPSKRQIRKASEGIFEVRDIEEFGPYYDKTLMAWYDNLKAAWNSIKGKFKDPDRFFRVMEYYLLSSAGTFRSGQNTVWQYVFARPGEQGGYAAYRLP
ncbi:MAG: cyclopropane fatty acyl phospholipid synthase [DPANN group archaeon]|nr:cyclopropane fatty acyl phospholipid synthase [DPANN group archaeon]